MTAVVRRARPALGTLVELGVQLEGPACGACTPAAAEGALQAGWAAVAEVEQAMSAFLPASDVGRFNAAPAGAGVALTTATAAVLRTARELQRQSGGLLDVSLGSGPEEWWLEEVAHITVLRKRSAAVRLDLGGIAKGYAVDRALEAMVGRLERSGQAPRCWVDAGGDLRTQGVDLQVHLRDELRGGARPWLGLRSGAVATSHFGPRARSRLAGGAPRGDHVSVASPRCILSDALTKVVALSGRPDHPVLAAHRATAWIHPQPLQPGTQPLRGPQAPDRHDAPLD